MNINIEEMRMNTDMSRAYLKNQNEFDVFPMYIENHLAGDFACAVAVKLAKQQARIKELEKASEWVSVDIDPKKLGSQLVVIKEGPFLIVREGAFYNSPDDNFNYWEINGKHTDSILFHKPLPKPPEGKS